MSSNIHFAKMLALMPVVALAAACNGVAPTSSTDVSTGFSATDSGEVTAMAVQPCSNITGINLRTESVGRMVWVQAKYNIDGPTTTQCAAPKWSSDLAGLTVDRTNPFRAGYPASTDGVANVTATAPNRVSNTITLNLGRGGVMAPAEQVNQACRLIDAVSVHQVPSVSGRQRVTLEAVYSYSQPVTSECTKAPSWTASRKGLVVANDGFHASIARVATSRTTVTATAPNRVKGTLTF